MRPRPARIAAFPPVTLRVARVRPPEPLPFPLGLPTLRMFSDPLRALWAGLRGAGIGPGCVVLVPSLLDAALVATILRTGAVCAYYELDSGLAPDPATVDALLAPGVRALYLNHFLGLPQDAARWRAWADERGVLLIEDCTQAWLAERDGAPVGSMGDIAVFCPPATVAVPDGGALVTREAAPEPGSPQPLGVLALARRTRWLAGDGGLALWPRADATALRLGDADRPASAATRALLPRLADGHIAARRRAHYESLADALGDLVPAALRTLPAGASPLVFPVETDARQATIDRLRRQGVHAVTLWPPAHPSLPAERFPAAARRRERGVGLPLHQEMGPGDVERVVRAAGARRPRGSEVRLEPIAALDEVGEEWDALARESRNVFATREWLSTWLRHRPVRDGLATMACRAGGGRLAAILPLYASTHLSVRMLRFLGHGTGDQLGPICAPADRTLAARALRRLLASGDVRWDVLVAHHVPADQGWDALLGGRILQREPSPVLCMRGECWDDFMATLRPKLRQEIRYDARRLAREHDVVYRLTEDPDRLERDLDTLFRLHAAHWGETSSFLRWERFHRDMAAIALERGWLRLWALDVDGRTVAMKYNLRFAGAEFSYQAARDVSFRRISLGLVLVTHAMRSAFEDGIREYRLLRGGEAYKYRFPSEDRAVHTVGVARGGMRASVLAAADLVAGAPALLPVRRSIGSRLRSR